MELLFSLAFAGIVGFGHAFEADHLIAVSSIVTRRNNLSLAIKDGIYWGLGHTSTVFFIGLMMIVGRATFLNGYFSYFEATVGFMLILLGFYRLFQYFRNRTRYEHLVFSHEKHHLAYGIGLVHGLAGSGAMVLLVMTEIQDIFHSLLYLLIFGIGSVVGMLVAAGIFSLPFSKKVTNNQNLQLGFILLASFLCIAYGIHVVVENLF